MFRHTAIAVLATSIVLNGQAHSIQSDARIAIFPPTAAAFDELRQHLGFSETNVEQLRKLLEERSEALQEIFRQISQKRTELQNLLSSGSRDVNRIGQLMLDIQTLNTQPPPSDVPWRQRALAILTPDQRTKLGALDQAIKLSIPAYQAVTFNLIDPPPPGTPRILPANNRELPTLPAPGTPIPLPRPLP